MKLNQIPKNPFLTNQKSNSLSSINLNKKSTSPSFSDILSIPSNPEDFFTIISFIGKGAFGSVYIVKRKQDNKIYAMKRVNINNLSDKDKRSSLNEIRILASLNHPNIISYKEAFFDEETKTLNIVMEYAEEGDIENKVKENLKHRLRFKEETIWEWLIQILEGLKYLHDNKIMHRDLKCANIFITKNGILKLGDLNVSIIAKMGMAKTKGIILSYC